MQDQAHLGAGGLDGNKPFAARIAKWCTYLLIAFPIVDYTLRLSVFHGLGSIWDKVVLLILALVALNRYIRGHRPAGFAWAKFAGWYILYCFALMLIGLGHASVAFDGFRMDIYYILFGLLLPFIVDPDDVPKFLYAGAAVGILLGVHGVIQYVMAPQIPSGWVDVTEHVRTRVFSVLKSPNELGVTMEMMIPIIFGLCLWEKNRTRKWVYGFGGLFCLLTLLFTGTRGAWMGFGIALFVVAIAFERKLLIALVVLGVIGFFLPPIHHRVMDLFNPVYMIKSSQGGRIIRWQTAFDVMSANPLFGAGLGHYGGAVASTQGYSIYSDNYYAKVLGESGLVGLVLFVSMHVAILREMMVTVVKRAKGRDRYLAMGGFAGILAVLVHNFVENVFEYAPSIMLYFVMVGLFLLWGRSLEKNQEGQHEK
ncbi:O-antigen ligase family protein [Alicyclobacillus fastidiosus]|uniref:O-antigen ligase family protein n=1 Tax=Alicyclobacillus fastidiosus TaxID=392011 RepID=A0ABV5AJP3_9BACL|nr:O-antigen ligase family protein [Alicyclobacillus fastidiosus]WEH08035.1 O-antigen ligase family protein [Alicyclobacillus fastidiosus]